MIRVRGGHYAGAETAFLKGFAIYETAVDTVRCASAWTSIPCLAKGNDELRFPHRCITF